MREKAKEKKGITTFSVQLGNCLSFVDRFLLGCRTLLPLSGHMIAQVIGVDLWAYDE